MELNNKVNLVLGTMTFGEQVFGSDVKNMLECFFRAGYKELDTAYVYNEGECERLLGIALESFERNDYEISTKVNPRVTGRLDGDSVIAQVEESLNRLRVKSVNTLYLHFPDPETPVEYALEACEQLYDKGKFRELGLSNFPAWMVAEVYHICKNHNWVLPSVYEGLYNPLSRYAERELDRTLDYYGMRFYAYNPLAGGMLTDKYSFTDRTIKEGRFTYRPNYQQRYWKDSYFNAVEIIKSSCAECGINIVEASYRWLAYHSMLKADRGDAIIIGASRISQLEENLRAVKSGKLPEKLTQVFNEAWKISKADAPEYFKFYVPTN